MQPTLPKDFMSIADAVALINSDTRSDAKVDTKWLVNHIDWIEEKHNFRIPLMKTTADKKVVCTGSKYVEIRDEYDKVTLKRAIRDHYRDMVGHEYEKPVIKAVSSVADDEVGTGVRPRRSKPIAKEGQLISNETISGKGVDL